MARLRPSLDWLLVLVPVSIVLELAGGNELLIFLTAAGAILPLAGLIGRSTDQLALHTGPRIGGLVNATFGNVTELVIAIFLILDEQVDIVKASLTGSIIGNLLLVLGLSFLLGGLRHEEQTYNARSASIHATSLVLAVAAVLMILYAAALLFTLVTHEHLFRTPSPEERPEWSRRQAVGMLLVATAFVALEAEFLVSSLEPALEDLGLSEFFVGLIVIPIIGNAAEHSSAIMFALRDKVDVTLEIAIGSSTQIALFVAPALVFISLFVGHPMDFVFSTFEVAAVALSTILVFMISSDGRSNWLEGAQLTGAYVIMAISFFFVEAL